MVITYHLYAQQQTMYSNYIINGFAINPAIAGTSELFPIQLSVRQQWIGIENAPQTQSLSTHTDLGRNRVTGVGGMVYHDAFGAISEIGVMGAFSYKIKVYNKTQLSFGLALSATQFSFNNSNQNIINDDDIVFNQSTDVSLIPDANFGLYLYDDKYFLSLSSTQLLQLPIALGSGNKLNKTVRHYYLYGGYKFKLNDVIQLEPSLMLKTTEQSALQIDINAKLIYSKNYFLALSYRHKESAIVMFGVKVDRYSIAYAFDYSVSKLKNVNSGSHEIVLRFDIKKQAKSSALL